MFSLRRFFHLSFFSIAIMATSSPLWSQAFTDSYLRELIKPNSSRFLLREYTKKVRDYSGKEYLQTKVNYYYNPDNSLGKKEISLNNRNQLFQIFLTDNGKFVKVIETRFFDNKEIKFEERYNYNSNGRLISIEKYNLSGLRIQKRGFPLLVALSRIEYNAINQIIKITTLSLTQHFFEYDQEITPAEINNFDKPIRAILELLDKEIIEYEYSNGQRSKKTIHKGKPDNTTPVRMESWKMHQGSFVHTTYIPGTQFRYEVRKERDAEQILRQVNWIYENDKMVGMTEKRYDQNSGALIFWEDKILTDAGIQIGTWQFTNQKLPVKKNHYEEPTSVSLPIKGTRTVLGKVDREIEMGYDQYGNVNQRSLYEIKTIPKEKPIRELVLQETWTYKTAGIYYKRPPKDKK